MCKAARLLCFTLGLWLHSQSAQATGLPGPVLAALKTAGIPVETVAVTVQDVTGHQPRLSWNAERAMNPASVMKLLTTYAGLELLGPAYAWRTEVWYTGKIEAGVLSGDLYFRGTGDPALTIERFALLLRDIRARGIRDIRGDLVLDRSAFQVPPADPGAFDGEPLSPYNALPDALLLNFKAWRLTLVPGAKHPDILPTPDLSGLTLENRITQSNGPCGQWDEALSAEWQAAGLKLVLSGSYPTACGEKTWNLSLLDAGDYFQRAFRPLWRELGGSLSGPMRQATVPADARLLTVALSPPLAQVVRDINKFSNNVMARQLFLSLGLESLKGTRSATPADGDAAIRRWLQEKRLSLPELVLENGAGLSRRERLSAESLNRLLLAAWAGPTMPEFISSLPIAAVDGTMRRRLGESGVAGNAHIKTGSLSDVKSIAGYVTAKSGRRYAVVFIANGPKANTSRPAQDALLRWVWEDGH